MFIRTRINLAARFCHPVFVSVAALAFCLLVGWGLRAESPTLHPPLQIDYENAVAQQPFRPEGRPLAGLVITLDAGHGGSSHQRGYAGSARGVNSGVVEGDLNMLVTATVRHHLRRAGATVHMTRWDDRKVSLGEGGEPSNRSGELGARVNVAEETRSHLFLSMHHNSAARDTADGVMMLIWPTDKAGNDQPLERAYAEIMRQEVQKQVPYKEEFKSHYITEHPLVSYSDIPSAVVEFGFLSNADFDAWVSQPGSHLKEAVGVYNGIVRMWEEHGEELRTLRDELMPAEERERRGRGGWGGRRGWTATYWPFERAPETAEEAEHIIEVYRRGELTDRTFFHVDADVEKTEEGWTVSGSVNMQFLHGAISELLENAGCEPLENNLRVLPKDSTLGDKKYGVVQIPMALTYPEPEMNGRVATQLLLGERVWLLDSSEDGEYLLHMAGDGYLGWVRREAILPLNEEEFLEWQKAPRANLMREYLVNDFRLPTGATLPVIEVNQDSALLRLPKGVRATERAPQVEVPLDALRLPDEISPGLKAANTAKQFLGSPYVFGGRSSLGIDCSGFCGVAYQAHGLRLPRDAKQQILVGELVATPWNKNGLRPGDLVYFRTGSGRISHMGMSIGGSRFMHAATPQVHVASLDPDDPLYNSNYANRFAFARRPAE